MPSKPRPHGDGSEGDSGPSRPPRRHGGDPASFADAQSDVAAGGQRGRIGAERFDRNEYAALKEIARAGGDLSASPQLSRNPRFTQNPDAVAKAKAIYDGTYEP
ncbi:hypothetical protein [Paractinoplanes atraurantiacus]|uniref:hypothetical protein n=1 Tax=Paractinoplanes atraurantiacus TaxID=1036182 RepID=UPI000BE39F28|nr:hypothetical protein [Actinoplanes atraurantiacus]